MKKNPWITAVLNFFFNGAKAITMDEQGLAMRLDQCSKRFGISSTGGYEIFGLVWGGCNHKNCQILYLVFREIAIMCNLWINWNDFEWHPDHPRFLTPGECGPEMPMVKI